MIVANTSAKLSNAIEKEKVKLVFKSCPVE